MRNNKRSVRNISQEQSREGARFSGVPSLF
jgi:hypothetical protein